MAILPKRDLKSHPPPDFHLTSGPRRNPIPHQRRITQFKDGETVGGQFNHHKAVSLPEAIIPCSNAAGEIWEVAEGMTKWKSCDKVLALPYPEYRTGRITEEMLGSGVGSSRKGE